MLETVSDAVSPVNWNKPVSAKTLRQLATAMAKVEGFYIPNSRAERNANPGNLKYSPFTQNYDAQGFAVFPSFKDGWDAFLWDLKAKQEGRTRTGLNGESTLKDLIWVWSEDNQETYLSSVLKELSLTSYTKLKEFLS